MNELLQAPQDRLALGPIELAGLLAEETVEIGVPAVRERRPQVLGFQKYMVQGLTAGSVKG